MVSDSDDTADHTNDPSSPHCAQTSTFSYDFTFFFHLDIVDFLHKPIYLFDLVAFSVGWWKE